MEHSCYQCGVAVEDGTAFCHSCGAPQIRVPFPQTDALTETGSAEQNAVDDSRQNNPGIGGEETGEGAADASIAGAGFRREAEPEVIDWSQAVPGAALAGVIVAFSWALPFVGFFVWMLATGVVAVLIYRRRVPRSYPTSGMGARIGALAGLFGFGVFVLLLALQMLVSRESGRFRQLLQQVMEQAAAQNADPRAQEVMQRLTSPEGMALVLTLVLVMSLAGFLLFSSLGGAAGAYLIRRRER